MVLPGTTYLWLATIIISDEGSTSMSLISMILLVLIAGICGAVGQSIAGYSRGGCLASVAVGFIGAMLGMWVARMVGMHELFAVRSLCLRSRETIPWRNFFWRSKACLTPGFRPA